MKDRDESRLLQMVQINQINTLQMNFTRLVCELKVSMTACYRRLAVLTVLRARSRC
jgi:hypothetical protein